jgi:RNase H-fold protein (predicted Holliday junction resolvase)
MLDAERARSDKAQIVARLEEDRVRVMERYQKRLIAEALLEMSEETQIKIFIVSAPVQTQYLKVILY